jgi:tagatose 6-phosphate kinase
MTSATVLAIGVTPAWQQTIELPRLALGEVNRAANATWTASGKVVNVGLALHSLGANSLTICPFGGHTGEELATEFEATGASARWLRVAARTRVCTTLLDADTQQTTELVENALPLTPDELLQYQHLVRGVASELADQRLVVAVSGSLPRGTPPSFFAETLHGIPATLVLDIRGPELLACLPLKPLVVKPNKSELAASTGMAIDSTADLRRAMTRLRELGAQWVVVSDGPHPMAIQGPDGDFVVPPIDVNVVNPIGCGDCLAAGVSHGLAAGLDVPAAVCLGMAAATDNATRLLSARLNPQRVAIYRQQLVAQRAEKVSGTF